MYEVNPQYSWWGKKDIIPGGRIVKPEFEYSSGMNSEWLNVEELREKLKTDVVDH